jgi:PPOX class probable F420-dependent enzyme
MNLLDTATPAGAAAERRMHDEAVGWLTTVGRDGTPQTSVVAFLWDGETITIYSEPEAPKVTNLVENHQCSFHLNSDAHGLSIVTIEGTAQLPAGGPLWSESPGFVKKYAAVFEEHWGLGLEESADTFNQRIVITPKRVRVW